MAGQYEADEQLNTVASKADDNYQCLSHLFSEVVCS